MDDKHLDDVQKNYRDFVKRCKENRLRVSDARKKENKKK